MDYCHEKGSLNMAVVWMIAGQLIAILFACGLIGYLIDYLNTKQPNTISPAARQMLRDDFMHKAISESISRILR